jgi:hypothetical protein
VRGERCQIQSWTATAGQRYACSGL